MFRHNPEQLARPFPAWYRLYFELSEMRIQTSAACAAMGVDPAILAEAERPPAAIRSKAGALNLLDLIALDAIAQQRERPEVFKFLIKDIWHWNELAWQAVLNAVNGRDTWIAIQPEERSHYTGYCLEDVGTHPADALPVNIGDSALRVLVGERWPRLQITKEADNGLKIVIEGSGCLRLERLPTEGESLEWPKRVEKEMTSYRPLSAKNIRDVDPIYRATPMWSDDPAVLKERIDEAIDEVLAISLDPRVPKEIRQMFEVVKSAAAYGYFYRPLTTLAASQVYSIEDAALYHRCLGAMPLT